jgi:biotin operon repressor
MKKTLPDHLINRFTELTNDIEAAIRLDEQRRILKRIRGNMEGPVTGKYGEPVPVGMNTGMHGESLAGNSHPAAGGVVPFTRSHRQMLGYLEKGYIAVPTLAGHLNVKKQTVYDYMQHLKRAGYDIQSRNTGNNRGGYNKIYRLAKSA